MTDYNSQDAKQLERGIYSPNINDRNDSNPVIFSPPKIPGREVKDVKDLNQHYNELDTKPPKDTKSRRKKKRPTKSLNDVYSQFAGYSPIQGKEAPTLTELSRHMDEGEHASKPDNSYSLKNESAISSGEDRSLLDEFTSMLYEFSTTKDEFVAQAEIAAKDISKESSPIKNEDLDVINSQKESLLNEFTFMLEESSSITDNMNDGETEDEYLPLEEISSHEHDDENKVDEVRLENPITENSHKPEENIFVKLPVLLAKINFDIDIFNSFDLACPIANVTKIDWVIESLSSRTMLPSNTVFLKGVLIAKIEYVSEKATTLHTLKVPITWDKVVDVNWLASPENAGSYQKEYTFQSDDTHYEYSQAFVNQIEEDVQNINFIWHNKLDVQGDTRKLHIEGRANISIDLLQQQYVNLNFQSFLDQVSS